MTKGEYPGILKESDSETYRPHSLEASHNYDKIHGNLILNKTSDRFYLFSEETDNTGNFFEINGVYDSALVKEINTHNAVNVVDYVHNLPNITVRQTITRILSKDDVQESEIDINDIEHYLLVATTLNSQNTLKCCENKLIAALTPENCVRFFQQAEQYNLKNLQEAAHAFIQNNCSGQSRSFPLNQSKHSSQNQFLPANKIDKPTGCKSNNRYTSYYAIFTCGKIGSKRTVATVVLGANMERKCYKDLKKGNKISTLFPCCCVQADENVSPLIFFSFGSSVHRYDPIMNKCTKRKSLICKRSKFCMVAHDNYCYVIGGVYKGRKVLQIEGLSCAKKNGSWKKVAMLPRECLPIDASCVVFNNSIYIFCAIVNEDNGIKRATGVYVFNPSAKTVNPFVEIPYSFKHIKTCVLNSYIYVASDKEDFIRFCPRNGSFKRCQNQIIPSKNFGIFTRENSVFVAGGECDGEPTDVIRKYCVISEKWEILSVTLPDCMTICDSFEVKIPNKWGAIVPFYETNLFAKR